MKKFLLFFFVSVCTLTAFAELNGDGYYRVQNAYTKRYAYLLDNTGYIDSHSSSADVGALELYLKFLRASSDPATVFYIEGAGSGSYYDIAAQGTSIYGFLGEYMKIIKGKTYDGQQSYYAYATKSGLTKYLGDRRVDMNEEKGLASADATKDSRLWYIEPLDASVSERYFGIAPTLTAGGKYYYPLYASFPFSAYSKGVKFYYVYYIDYRNGIVITKEINGTVPAGQPVIVECENPLAADNRLNIGASGTVASIGDNRLKGVYFDNSSSTHYNRTRYDKRTMRILKVVNGKLTFVVGDEEFLPRNQAYLQLTWDPHYDVANYTVMKLEDYNKEFGAVEAVTESSVVDVYGIDGRLIKSGMEKADVPALGSGLYILKSEGHSEKLIVR